MSKSRTQLGTPIYRAVLILLTGEATHFHPLITLPIVIPAIDLSTCGPAYRNFFHFDNFNLFFKKNCACGFPCLRRLGDKNWHVFLIGGMLGFAPLLLQWWTPIRIYLGTWVSCSLNKRLAFLHLGKFLITRRTTTDRFPTKTLFRGRYLGANLQVSGPFSQPGETRIR